MERRATKRIALTMMIAVAVVIVVCATLLGCKDNAEPPTATVTGIIGEPEYVLTIEWNAVKNATVYVVEYEYELYKGRIHEYKTTETKVTVGYMRGNVNYRVKAITKSQDTGFSEWATYGSEGFELDALRTFNVNRIDGRYYIDADTFEPVAYTYKGERKTINYYEFDMLPPGATDDEHSPVTYSLTQIQEGFAFNISDIKGVWRLYARPALYVDINGEKDYSQVKELYELYRQEPGYIIIEITV